MADVDTLEDLAATSSGSAAYLSFGQPSSAVDAQVIGSQPRGARRQQERSKLGDRDKAVYWTLRAMRSVGKTAVNTVEIADALDLSVAEVEAAIVRLQDKGVKVVE